MAIEPAPRRGEVWLVAFGPSISGEIQKTRPAVVISNDTANARLNRMQVVPICSQVARLYPAEAYVSLNRTFPSFRNTGKTSGDRQGSRS